MLPRDKVYAVLRGEQLDEPCFLSEVPMDVTALAGIIPHPTGDVVQDEMNLAEFFGNTAVSIRCSPITETLERDETHHIYRYETGAVWHENYNPSYFRKATQFPIVDVEDLDGFVMPSADRAIDRKTFSKQVAELKDAGYFVQGLTLGIWGGIYYYLTEFTNILEWMIIEEDAAHAIFNMMVVAAIQMSGKTAKLMS